MTKTDIDEYIERATELQNNKAKFIKQLQSEAAKRNMHFQYETMEAVFFDLKFAELESRILKLENKPNTII